MKKPVLKIILSSFLSVLLLSQLLFQAGCANIVPPEGGFKDTLPPVLTRATPPNNTRNFPTDRFTLTFDEYIDLDNYQQNLIVSPLPENMPNVTRKLNTITVKLRDSVESNTTYTFNFGKSIKDINEGNLMNDFTYSLSTGAYMDSLELSGRVLLAETGETDSTLTILLHRDSVDSAVIKKRPRFIARTNGNGSFHFTNLPPGTFYIYAMKDEGSYRYLSPKQLFAFADSAVTVGAQTDSVILYAYVADKESAAPAARSGNKPADSRLKFQTNVSQGKKDLTEKLILTFETPVRDFDSSKIDFSTDSSYIPVPDHSWTLDSTRKNLVLDHNWKENTSYNLVLEKDFATDTLKQQLLKSDTIHFTTKTTADYGKLTIRFRNLDLSKNPVLQFIQGNDIKKSFPLNSETFSVALFEPGEYNLRILQDTNKNGRWDPGDFFGKRIQPELVKPVSRKITVRANWDDSVEIVL